MKPSTNEQLARTVSGILLAPPTTRCLNFDIGSIKIRSADYVAVGNAIASGDIAVNYNKDVSVLYKPLKISEKGVARYSQIMNHMTLCDAFEASDKTHVAVLIHEATHAALDRQNIGPTGVSDDEAAAYLAESLYLQILKLPPRSGITPEDVLVFTTAEQVSKSLLAGKNLNPMERSEKPVLEVPKSDAQRLANAVSATSTYKDKSTYNNDGL